MRAASILVTLLGAALLFLVQPMVARMPLPSLGGAPAVWNTRVLFFQTALLLGYLYAHLVSSRLPPRRGVLLHLSLLAASIGFLPIRWTAGTPVDGSPVPWLLGRLCVSVGLPFLLLSATGPLVQRWLHSSHGPGAGDPYPLYAVGNLGSLVSLADPPLVHGVRGIRPPDGDLRRPLAQSGSHSGARRDTPALECRRGAP